MWPFAKLRNGFGSHRCIYSPILLDSQVANSFYLSTGSSARAGDASPVTTIVPRVVDKQWNGEANGYHLSSWLQVQHLKMTMVTGFLPMRNGNAYDQLPSQLPGSCCGTSSCYYASGRAGFFNGEWRM